MTSNKQTMLLILLGAFVIVLANSFFIVDEREKALVIQLGKIKDRVYPPGLHFKFPFADNARFFDARILSVDNRPERFLTVEKKNLNVDFFVKWRITDVDRFYRATQGDEIKAMDRLTKIVKDGLKGEFANRTIQEAVSGERNEIMRNLEIVANEKVQGLGIEVVDLRIKRIDLPDQISGAVYERMRAERKRIANDFRARGAEAAERIRAEADREREVILATAYKEAEQIRGDGDAKATEIYATAYKKDAEFYSFYRSLDVYRTSWKNQEDVLLLEPDGELFQYFNPGGVK